jgi:hypothetical protein
MLTETTVITTTTTIYTTTLPSGGEAHLTLSATAGDVGIMIGLGLVALLLAALLIHTISREAAAKWLR